MTDTPRPAIFSRFWSWYERHYALAVTLTAGLFALQLVHLAWLSADVVAERLTGRSYVELTPVWQFLIILVDYTEIPSLLSTTVFYLYQLQRGRSVVKSVLFLILVNSQWLHLFWITDEFVVEALRGAPGAALPVWLAWVAIVIDYLELPVIADTIARSIQALRQGKLFDYWKEEAVGGEVRVE